MHYYLASYDIGEGVNWVLQQRQNWRGLTGSSLKFDLCVPNLKYMGLWVTVHLPHHTEKAFKTMKYVPYLFPSNTFHIAACYFCKLILFVPSPFEGLYGSPL